VTLALRVIIIPNSSFGGDLGASSAHVGWPLPAGRQKNRHRRRPSGSRRWVASVQLLRSLCRPCNTTPGDLRHRHNRISPFVISAVRQETIADSFALWVIHVQAVTAESGGTGRRLEPVRTARRREDPTSRKNAILRQAVPCDRAP
jgi:hypothetical protein